MIWLKWIIGITASALFLALVFNRALSYQLKRRTKELLDKNTKLNDEISERKRVEKTLIATEQRYRNLFNRSYDLIFLHTVKADSFLGEIIEVNQIAMDSLGYSNPSELIGKRMMDLISLEEHLGFSFIVDQLKETNHYLFEAGLKRKSGLDLPVEIHMHLLELSDEKSLLSIIRDISGRHQAEELSRKYAIELENQVEKRTRSLLEINDELQAFAYTVSHDLQTPIKNIQLLSEALIHRSSQFLSSEDQQALRNITQNADFLVRMIRDLLVYSRLGRVEIPLEVIPLGQLTAEILVHLESEIREKNAQVTVQKPLPRVIAHRVTLGQVIQNLITNALKFVAPGVHPAIIIRSEIKNNDQARVWIEDNGIGIPPQYQERIFRIFERLHSSNTYPGTGIGLAIARKGVERMGGRMGVESQSGKGARFWFELPLEKTEPT